MRFALGLSALFITSSVFAVTLNLNPTQAAFAVLARRAEVAAHVRVVQQAHRLNEGRIVTDSVCEVLDAAYGATAGETVVITTLGGYYGNIGQTVFGLEPLAPGDELAVFLDRAGYMQGGRSIVGMNLGVYRVLEAPSEDRAIVGYGSYAFPSRDETPATIGGFLAAARAAGGR